MKCFEEIFKEINEDVDPKYYLDDILIYGDDEEDLLRKLSILIPTLYKRQVTINGLKCESSRLGGVLLLGN